jgi:hypothetical protein
MYRLRNNKYTDSLSIFLAKSIKIALVSTVQLWHRFDFRENQYSWVHKTLIIIV